MFIKFKKYMKNVKSNMISDLQGYKNILNMLELWPLDFQKYVDMLKDTKSNEVIDMLNEVLGDLTKYDIKSAKERLKEHIEILSTHIYTCDSQIRAFDNEKAIGAIEDFPLFYVTLISIICKNCLTNKEAIKIFGSAISFKGKKTGENKTPEDLWKCDFESLRPLSNYFDIYGNFQNGGDSELLMILFNQLSKATRLKELAINNDELKLIKYTSLSSKLMFELRSSYEEYLKTAVKREIKAEIKKEKKSEVREEALEPVIVETEKLSFLTNEDKEIYLMACTLISSLVGRSDYDYYMEALLDIQSLEELYNEEDKKWDFGHNPFSMPQGGIDALNNMNPGDIVAYQYDFVCNGNEMASGAVRNHDINIMKKAFSIAGYSEDVVKDKFRSLYTAFTFGAPPHAGMAPGIDRIIMLLKDEENIREIVPFPIGANGADAMMGCPSEAFPEQLKEAHIKLDL